MNEKIIKRVDKTGEWMLVEDIKDMSCGEKTVEIPVVSASFRANDSEDWEFVKSFPDFESAEEYVMKN